MLLNFMIDDEKEAVAWRCVCPGGQGSDEQTQREKQATNDNAIWK